MYKRIFKYVIINILIMAVNKSSIFGSAFYQAMIYTVLEEYKEWKQS